MIVIAHLQSILVRVFGRLRQVLSEPFHPLDPSALLRRHIGVDHVIDAPHFGVDESRVALLDVLGFPKVAVYVEAHRFQLGAFHRLENRIQLLGRALRFAVANIADLGQYLGRILANHITYCVKLHANSFQFMLGCGAGKRGRSGGQCG